MHFSLRGGGYANVTATLALIVALGGTGYAATQLAKNSVGTAQLKKNSVNSAKVKNGSLKAKDFKPGQLTSGPAGPAGSAGAAGAAGAAGVPGPAGPLPGFLPSGKSLTGGWGFGSQATAALDTIQGNLNFAFPTSGPVTIRIIQRAATPPAQCPGTVADPKAAPGNLCVYTKILNNGAQIYSYGVEDQTSYRYGAELYTFSSAVGNVDAAGTWAVTAP